MQTATSAAKRFAWGAFLLVGVGVLFAPRPAEAHFVLDDPPAWMSQDALGLPQKMGPCGDEYDGTDAATPTGTVTTVQEGQKITVTIHEVIFHPGHYRIALAQTRGELPAEPLVTPAATPCGSVPIMSPPVFPVLADGVFPHTTPFTTPQSIDITLPAGVTCTKCTLQVIEFMGDHPLNIPGGCFYHHCADLTIQSSADSSAPRPDGAAVPPATDSGTVKTPADAGSARPDSSTGGGAPPAPASSSGCGCRVSPGGDPAPELLALAPLVALVYRRRRPRQTASV